MSLNDALAQYQKCYFECEKRGNCPDIETKIKAAFDRYDSSLLKSLSPINPLRPFQPYKSKYFDDHRYDPPKDLTVKDVICAFEKWRSK